MFYLNKQFSIIITIIASLRLTTEEIKAYSYEEDMSSSKCSQIFDSTIISSGYLVSPNYPADYSANLFCVYEFNGRLNQRIILQIEDFELEAPKLISILESIEYDINDANDARTRQYTPSDRQMIRGAIEASDGIQSEQCFYDYFDVYSYNIFDYYEWRMRYCGTHIEAQIVSTAPKLKIVFASDRNLQHRGFKIRFYFSYVNILPFVTLDMCGKSNITGEGGVLASPNYPALFPNEIECAWTITVEKHKKILIRFVDLNLNEPCHLSYIHIWDAFVDKLDQPDLKACEKLSFYLRGEKYIKTKTNRAVIKFNGNKVESTISYIPNVDEQKKNTETRYKRFLQDKTEVKHGFLIVWSAVYEDNNCQEFQCKGGELCIDEKSFLCSKKQAYCISNELVCDGYSHCDVGDDSDEQSCRFKGTNVKLYIILAITGVSVVVLILIVCMIICIIRHKRRLRVEPPSSGVKEYFNGTTDYKKGSKQKQTIEPPLKPQQHQSQKQSNTEIKYDSQNNSFRSSHLEDQKYFFIGPTNIKVKKREIMLKLSKSHPELLQESDKKEPPSGSIPSLKKRPSYSEAQSMDIISLNDYNYDDDENAASKNKNAKSATTDFLNVNLDSNLRRDSYTRAINV